MFLGDVGRSSVDSFYEIWMDGERYAEGAARIVWIDLATGRSTPLPEAVSAPLRAWRRPLIAATPSRPAAQSRYHRADDPDRTALAAVPGTDRRGEPDRVRRAGVRGDRPSDARLRVAVAVVDRRASETFWRAVWDYAGIVGDARRAHAGRRRPDARRAVVSRTRGSISPRTCSPRRAGGRPGARRWCSAARTRSRGSMTNARAPRAGVAACRGAGGGRASTPATGSPPTCPTCPRRSPPCSRRPAAARSGRRARRTSASRACSTASARSSRKLLIVVDGYWYNGKPIPVQDKVAAIAARLPLGRARRRRTVPARGAGHVRRTCRDSRRRRAGCVRRAASGGADRLPAAAVRPSALHPLLVGDDRRAQVHRPRRRRHAAAAPQGAPAARRREARRPPLLLHHLRLDDVELADVGTRHRRDAAALRRLAVRPARQGAVGFRRPRADDAFRHLGQVHRRGEEDLRSSRARTTSSRPCGRCSRPAARCRPRASTTSTSA